MLSRAGIPGCLSSHFSIIFKLENTYTSSGHFIGARRCSDSATDTPHCSSTTYPGSGSCSSLSGTISRNSNSLFCLFPAQLRRRVKFCKMPICFANAKSRLVGVRRSFAKNGTKPLHGYRHGTTDDALDDLLCGGRNSISCHPSKQSRSTAASSATWGG
uniref:Uncharacterized protein n=1 Tax=Candidatus Kentrum sp. LPFa TaxID=2126335 RepID=A0A450W5Z1_9GAMM|nr:MAG: hypothetical protein BECKLPF1236B_GA0070989_10361 [Candidatus Kentron sp. LPFa]